jgi:hypothetical protein
MRSIITTTVVLLAIVGLVNAQNRRSITNFDMSEYQDLVSAGMGITKAIDLIDNICRDYHFLHVAGAINVETNETMMWTDYMNGPGINGDPKFRFAIYPWSVVRGTCTPLLYSTWATDREVVYGPYVNNTRLHTRWLSIGMAPRGEMGLLAPKSNASTTLSRWVRHLWDPSLVKDMFFKQAPQDGFEQIGNSMVWNRYDRIINTRRFLDIPGCTQARLTAASVMRTMIGVHAFQLEEYNLCIRSRKRKWGFGTVQWETVQSAKFDVWMDVRKDQGGNVVLDYLGDEWKTVYSSEGYVKVEGLSLLMPGETMIVQVEFRGLPPQDCAR